MTKPPLKTFLYDLHLSLNAKMAPFGGFEMPISYEGIIAEHNATRTNTTLFDTCHMGEFSIEGTGSLNDLENILSCDIASLKTGRCKYGFICNEYGGVIDDQIIYRTGESSWFMVVNASTQDADLEWIQSKLSSKTLIKNLSQQTAKIDVQGPGSVGIMLKLLGPAIIDLPYYGFAYFNYKNTRILISRTGYTGEVGFELYMPPELIFGFFNNCMELGAKPAGLGARDTLRLEMGLPLYGHELSAERNAAESGFSRAIAKNKKFIGSSVVLDPARVTQRLAGIILHDRRAARAGDLIVTEDGSTVGIITSGSFSPTLGMAIAMGYINRENSAIGNSIIVKTATSCLNGKIVTTPFITNATARQPLSDFL